MLRRAAAGCPRARVWLPLLVASHLSFTVCSADQQSSQTIANARLSVCNSTATDESTLQNQANLCCFTWDVEGDSGAGNWSVTYTDRAAKFGVCCASDPGCAELGSFVFEVIFIVVMVCTYLVPLVMCTATIIKDMRFLRKLEQYFLMVVPRNDGYNSATLTPATDDAVPDLDETESVAAVRIDSADESGSDGNPTDSVFPAEAAREGGSPVFRIGSDEALVGRRGSAIVGAAQLSAGLASNNSSSRSITTRGSDGKASSHGSSLRGSENGGSGAGAGASAGAGYEPADSDGDVFEEFPNVGTSPRRASQQASLPVPAAGGAGLYPELSQGIASVGVISKRRSAQLDSLLFEEFDQFDDSSNEDDFAAKDASSASFNNTSLRQDVDRALLKLVAPRRPAMDIDDDAHIQIVVDDVTNSYGSSVGLNGLIIHAGNGFGVAGMNFGGSVGPTPTRRLLRAGGGHDEEDDEASGISVDTSVGGSGRRPGAAHYSQVSLSASMLSSPGTPMGRALGRKMSMLGQDDKSHLPTGMNCLVFDDVMYKCIDTRNCLQKTLTVLPSASRWILRGVGGYLEAGRVTVLLGAAAQSGHTALLRILGQQYLAGESYGRFRWNCKEYNRRVFDTSGVYISPADFTAVPRHCTPREMLWLHAKFLFGHWMNDATLALSVQRALVSMDLEAEADQPIEVMEKIYGPSFLRWVLIARAVLRGFDILMLEEPLEGLDSVASMDLMKRIRRFARKTQAQRRGAIVAMTAHQPRQQVLDLVDDCFLLHQGTVLYCGEVRGMGNYFQRNAKTSWLARRGETSEGPRGGGRRNDANPAMMGMMGPGKNAALRYDGVNNFDYSTSARDPRVRVGGRGASLVGRVGNRLFRGDGGGNRSPADFSSNNMSPSPQYHRRAYGGGGGGHANLQEQFRASQILMDLSDIIRKDATNFAFLFKMSDEYSRLQATIKELLVATAGLDDEDDDYIGNDDFNRPGFDSYAHSSRGGMPWQTMDIYGDPFGTQAIASMADADNNRLSMRDMIRHTRNMLAMQFSAAPIDHRLAKFMLAWSVMYILFGTFYAAPLSHVNPLIVELSIQAPDSARFVEGMFQRLGCYYLVLMGAIIANWFIFIAGMDHTRGFRSVSLLAARHKKMSIVAKVLAQCCAVASSSVFHALWQTICIYLIGFWWTFVRGYAEAYMVFGLFLALVTLHTALQSMLLLISVATKPEKWMRIYIWSTVLSLVLCGFTQAAMFIPYYFIPFHYVNFMAYAFQALLYSDPIMKFNNGVSLTIMYSFGVFLFGAFFLALSSYLTMKHDIEHLSPPATTVATREKVQQQVVESQREAQARAAVWKRMMSKAQNASDYVLQRFWGAANSLGAFSDGRDYAPGYSAAATIPQTAPIGPEATPRRGSIVTQAASLSKASKHAFHQRQQSLVPRPTPQHSNSLGFADKPPALSIADFLDGDGITFDMIDANGDGIITRAEFNNFVLQLRARAASRGGENSAGGAGRLSSNNSNNSGSGGGGGGEGGRTLSDSSDVSGATTDSLDFEEPLDINDALDTF